MKNKHGFFIIPIDYGQKISKIISPLLFFSINKNINDENFPSPPEILDKKRKIICTPISFRDIRETKIILKELKKNSLRPANLLELLCFDREIEFNFPLVALGSHCLDYYGEKQVPGISFYSNYLNHFWWNEKIVKKNLKLFKYQQTFTKETHFLAVKTKPL